jgi:hypothetical protein
MSEINLDDLVVKEGQEFDETKLKIKETKEVLLHLNELAYKDDDIMTGTTQFPTSDDVAMSKEEAQNHALYEVAKNKLEKESTAFQKLSDEEKIKDYVFKAQYYKATNDFYHKNGFEMSGKQKRTIKRQIELAWKKGKFKLSEQDKIDILTNLANTASAQNGAQPQNKNANQGASLANLTSLTYKG